ncbi:hypothetical protein DFH08DRAFT_801990 [Mycena albidolilacea]|uniref:Ribonuclease H1 N-terminal domain-containing protein n=1 Tax=Mycena albidolilacea TaxID=1033008 RepID=A0AAD7AGG0_9AGAR|nr:hypothetical protein DFH08DRAFT_801990 [Mycena albidolilacea]
MVDLNLETAFSQLQLREDFFHPREGYEWTRGVEDLWFYVVSVGRIRDIYTHCREEASQQVTAFPSAVHKKYFSWSAARSAYEIPHLPKMISPTHTTRRSKNAAHTFPPSTPLPAWSTPPPARSTPPPACHPQLKAETPTARTGVKTDPSTLTGSPKKLMYVYSRDDGSTIYADPREASLAARRGLADGSFCKVDVTPRVHDAFNHATESALEVYYISSDDE